MLWIYLLVLFLLFSAGLMFFFWSMLTQKISSATGRLHNLSKDYAAKEEEASRLLQNAQKEAKGILSKETQVAQDVREQLIKEAEELKERMLKEATQKGLEISEKSQKNAEFIRKELDQKIDERAKELVNSLIQEVIPKEFLEDVHRKWIDESGKDGGFDFKNLKLPEKTKDATVISAFALTNEQQSEFKKQLKEKIGTEITLKTEVDPSLIVGFSIKLGSLVIDASLKNKIQKAMQQK